MLPFLLLLLINIVIATDNTMIIVWGTPSSTRQCSQADFDWEDCMQECSDANFCVLTATDDTGTCYLCQFQSVSEVQQTTREDGWKVAFKVQSFSTCPYNPQTFDAEPATGDMSTFSGDAYTRNYSISFSESKWTVSYYEKRRCADNFELFQRPTADYCLTLQYNNRSHSYDEIVAKNYCKPGTLSGVTSKKEWTYVKKLSYRILAVTPKKKMYLRLDGIRTENCQANPDSEECSTISALTTFDKTTLNYDAYTWKTNALAGSTTGLQCLVTIFDGKNDGKQDFAACTNVTKLMAYSFVCGFKAYD